MRVLITGGSGSVGKAIITRLVASGFDVLVIGRREGLQFDGAEYQTCDVNDYPRLREVVRGCESIVHLAAVPDPSQATPEELFRINCSGTFNVFQAAAEEGIQRVIQASSINSTGQFYGVRPAPLYYLPIDEDHPVFSTDAYSFSKNVIENIGEYFWRREGITSLAYRIPWVAPAEVHQSIGQRKEQLVTLIDRLLAKTPEERRAWFDFAWNAYNQFRAKRPFESGRGRGIYKDLPEDMAEAIGTMGRRVNFFTMLDERDSAMAVEQGLRAEFEGSHVLFVNDSKNNAGVDSQLLADLFYPDVTQFKKTLVGNETLVSIEKARQMLGFEPEYSFG